MSNFKHYCGGRAHLVGKVVYGWNICCCGRCGEVFYHWVTESMLKKQTEYNASSE
jgi:hypothetical protein